MEPSVLTQLIVVNIHELHEIENSQSIKKSVDSSDAHILLAKPGHRWSSRSSVSVRFKK